MVSRRRNREWTRQNALLLGARDDDLWSEALTQVLTTVISESGHEISVCEDEESAELLIEHVLRLIAKIGS
jgi:hypothetical protein